MLKSPTTAPLDLARYPKLPGRCDSRPCRYLSGHAGLHAMLTCGLRLQVLSPPCFFRGQNSPVRGYRCHCIPASYARVTHSLYRAAHGHLSPLVGCTTRADASARPVPSATRTGPKASALIVEEYEPLAHMLQLHLTDFLRLPVKTRRSSARRKLGGRKQSLGSDWRGIRRLCKNRGYRNSGSLES